MKTPSAGLGDAERFFQSVSDLEEARPFLEAALATYLTEHGFEHIFTFIHLTDQGAKLARREGIETARCWLDESLATGAGFIDPELLEVARLLALSNVYEAVGEIDLAIATKERALEWERRLFARIPACCPDTEHPIFTVTLRVATYHAISFHLHSAPWDQRAARQALIRILRRKSRGLHPGASTSAVPAPEVKCLELTDVRAALRERSALVELYLYYPWNGDLGQVEKPRYIAYILPHSGVLTWADLGEVSAVNRAVDSFLEALREKRADVRERARELDELTMAKVRKVLDGITDLVISPDDKLNLVPFAALVDEDGRYLVESFCLSYVTSGWDLVRTTGPRRQAEEPLILGDPDFGGGLQQLPGAAEEAREVGRILQAPADRVLTGAAATKAGVQKAHSPSVLHLATHGFLRPGAGGQRQSLEGSLARSGLALAGYSHGDEGFLNALEVTELDLADTEVAVLSACETGLGDVLHGEGVWGLRRAVVLAGARTQVMSLWHVPDEATKDLMVSWYGQIMEGTARAGALREIQRAAAHEESLPRTDRVLPRGRGARGGEWVDVSDPRIAGTRHPYYWAGFIVSGEPGPLPGRPSSQRGARHESTKTRSAGHAPAGAPRRYR